MKERKMTDKIKLRKVIVFVPDLTYDYPKVEDVIEDIEFHIDFSTAYCDGDIEIEWEDDMDINLRGATREDFEKYFESEK